MGGPRRSALPDVVREHLDEGTQALRRVLDGHRDARQDAFAELARAVIEAMRIAGGDEQPDERAAEPVPVADLPGRHLRRLRREAALTQDQLAQVMTEHGFPWRRETAAQAESGVRRIALDELVVLAAVFGEPLAAFLLPGPDDEAVQVGRDGNCRPASYAELVLGRDGRLGSGGGDWRAALEVAPPAGRLHPALARARPAGEDEQP